MDNKFHNLRNLLTAAVLMMLPLLSLAQSKIEVEKFELDDNNTTALNNPEYDNMGNACALIIVHNVDIGKFRFNLNTWSKVETAEINGKNVYLVWVPDGTNMMSISNDNRSIEPLNNYTFKRVRRSKTYNMYLAPLIADSSKSAYLKFRITPANSTLTVDGIPWTVNSDGTAYQLVKLGRHKYEVKSPGYHDDINTVTITTDQTVEVPIKLYANFGYLTLNGGKDLEGASIFVDNANIGTGNIQNHKLGSGRHTLTITKPKYHPYTSDFTIVDEQTTTLVPILSGNFATPTIRTTDPQASIYIDGSFVGIGSYTGPIEVGSHIVETRRDNHRSFTQDFTIASTHDNRTIEVRAPEAIYGSLSVESTPAGATVYIDGMQMGTTPYHTDNLLAGDHTVKLTMPNYTDYEEKVFISEHQPRMVRATLTNQVTVTVSVSPSYADVYCDGRKIDNYSGYCSVTAQRGSTRTLRASAYHYKDASQTIRFDYDKTVNMNLKYKADPSVFQNDVYVDLSGNYFTGEIVDKWDNSYNFNNIGFDFGGHLYGWNFQMDIMLTLDNPNECDALIAFHTGWGFPIGNHFKITPQIGMNLWTTLEENPDNDPSFVSFVTGLRMQIHIYKAFSLMLKPQWDSEAGLGCMMGISFCWGGDDF